MVSVTFISGNKSRSKQSEKHCEQAFVDIGD